ncbi:MAG: hypothetical protein RSD47_04040 [Romboutsia sp.]
MKINKYKILAILALFMTFILINHIYAHDGINLKNITTKDGLS